MASVSSSPPPPVDEAERLRVLASYDVLDTPPEAELDELVQLASSICGVPVALVSLIDESRQWFKAKVGVTAEQTPRDVAFCAHAIAEAAPGLFTVRDARQDPRFAGNPLVTGDPHVVFYAGAPLVVEGGAKLGTLCVIDTKPHELTPEQARALETLSRVVVRHLELRRVSIERQKLLEEARIAQQVAERANRSMDEFLATVSHELRTPLNAMLGWTRLLRGDRLPEAARPKALETIERNATAQAQLIEDLLDVSRIISGKMHVDALPLELPAVIDSALDAVRPAAHAKGIRLELDLDPAASHVIGDAGRLQQVVWNLLSNAVKFTPEGGAITVRLARSAAKKTSGADGVDAVQLRVTDSGIGLEPDMVDVIFERFRQADGTITRAHGGLGLGLAIAKTIVELHGGRIEASSPGKGKGASFVVHLPAPPAVTAPLAHPPTGMDDHLALTYPPHLRGLRVLVVDDEEDARELLSMVLESCGVVVTAARSVDEALAAVDREVPAIVVSDIGMPGQDGYGFARQLREREPERGGRIPAVAVTAYARAEDRTRALLAGFTSHVPKPIEPAELIAVIASLTAPRTAPS
jgi:signal transduction histidine kinase/ActR/RegA family two-component response regulator